jgi:hypothetical protein
MPSNINRRNFLKTTAATTAALALPADTHDRVLGASDRHRVAALVGEAQASSSSPGFDAAGAINRDRFSTETDAAWKGRKGTNGWWWQIRFPEPRPIGAILQINGDHATVFRNAPRRYVWRWSTDGVTWRNLRETETMAERRLFRIHRLREVVRAQYLRLQVFEAEGDMPTLREVEFFEEPKSAISFPDWIVAVSTAEESDLPAGGGRFIKLARACPGWDKVPAQEVWLGSFDEAFVSTEPRPLCAFLTGNHPEWCQRMQEPWRGVREVLLKRNLPMWGACGGGQALTFLEEIGMDRPWDCPRCRDPKNPLLPIYTHIGHSGPAVCGDYSKNIGEKGKCNMRRAARDPAFQGLTDEFQIMESHIGQIDYVPKGWTRVVTRGSGAHTMNQCLRVKDRYIYAAQFHMEMEGTPENSRVIMSNFLKLAKEWGGYNPEGKPVTPPEALPENAAPQRQPD